MTDTLVLPTQVAKPRHVLNLGQGEGLLRPHPAWGTIPDKLCCDKSRIKPSPGFVRACEMETQKG